MAQQVAWTYARAIVELGVQRRDLDEVVEAARELAAALHTDRELRQFLLSPVVGHRRVEITKLLEPVLPVSMIDTIGVILTHNRQSELPGILAAVAALADEVRGRVRVHVTTASALDAGVRTRLTEAMSLHLAADVVLDLRVDPAIVGGMVVRYKDKFVDGSVKERLAALKVRLLAQHLGSDYCNENQS